MRRLRQCAWFLTAAFLAAVTPTAVRAQPVTKHVLIIHGGPESFPGNDVFDAALREVLFSHPSIQADVHSEYLENEEFVDTADPALLEYLRVKFTGRPPDLVIANAAPALTFVLRHRDELFPNVPVVFASASEPDGLRAGTLRGVSGVLRLPSQIETVDLALKLHPATRRLHVVAYAPTVDGFQERLEAAMAVYSPRLTVSFTNEPTLPQALAVLKALPSDSLIFWVRYSPVTNGRVIFPGEFLPEIAKAAPVPIYTAFETFLGSGAVGGMMRTSTTDAHRLGAMGLRVLEGTPPERMAFEDAEVTPIFDWRALQRWGIDESALPAGAEIRYRVPTVWQLYGDYILATLVVVTAQLVLIAGLLRERARVRRADGVIRASEASLRSSYERIRHLAGQLINAQEAARAEIARDLHDDVCQRLANIGLSVSRLRRATKDTGSPTTTQAFEALDRDAKSALDGIRRLSHDLHPATMRLLGLVPALRSHCLEVAQRHAVEVTFSADEAIGDVRPDLAVCLFRVVQESLRNGITHGGARCLAVTLARDGARFALDVHDDGRGFDVGAAQANRQGLGLVMMEERANLVGGTVEIVSHAGAGTTVRVVAPAHQVNEAAGAPPPTR
jgi:signal transduction histidine kinase